MPARASSSAAIQRAETKKTKSNGCVTAGRKTSEVKVNIGTFNPEVDQRMLETRKSAAATRAIENLRRIINKMIESGDLHLLNLVEVGGHKHGLAATGGRIDDVLHGAVEASCPMAVTLKLILVTICMLPRPRRDPVTLLSLPQLQV